MIVDQLERLAQLNLPPRIGKALAALRSGELAGKTPGRYELDGDRIFALVQEYRTKPHSAGKLEAHRRYIDVQFVVTGTEAMGYAPLEGLAVAEAYDEARDIVFFAGIGDPVTVSAGMATLFFPHDAHAPGLGLTPAGGEPVRKIVVKIAVEELTS